MNLPSARPQDDQNTDAFAAAVKQGMDSADAGRVVAYKEVRKWLLSWGTETAMPKPECR